MRHILQDQLIFEAPVINKEHIRPFRHITVGGMGGSGLATGLLKRLNPLLHIHKHHSFGFPLLKEDIEDTFFVASSYSGNTKETLSFFKEACALGLNIGVIASGGLLIEEAKNRELPHIEIPGGIQPREVIGYSLKALSILTGQNEIAMRLSRTQIPDIHENLISSIGEKCVSMLPLIYSDYTDASIGYVWKIIFNETGKTLAFSNTYPELTHNEIESLVHAATPLTCIILRPLEEKFEHDTVENLVKLCTERHIEHIVLDPIGETLEEKMFGSITLAQKIALYIAEQRQLDSGTIPTIEWFKTLYSDQ